jgi:hypothetical protein
MLKGISFLTFLFVSLFTLAQDNETRFDNFYLEAGGAGLFYSINFERAIPDKESRKLGTIYSLGFNVLPGGGGILGSYNRYYGRSKKSQYMYGVGATVIYAEETAYLITLPLTYKYTFPNNRVYLGFSIYETFSIKESAFIPWAGLRVGYNFNMRCKYCRAL